MVAFSTLGSGSPSGSVPENDFQPAMLSLSTVHWAFCWVNVEKIIPVLHHIKIALVDIEMQVNYRLRHCDLKNE